MTDRTSADAIKWLANQECDCSTEEHNRECEEIIVNCWPCTARALRDNFYDVSGFTMDIHAAVTEIARLRYELETVREHVKKWEGIYKSAVRGRLEFREALKECRAEKEVLEKKTCPVCSAKQAAALDKELADAYDDRR